MFRFQYTILGVLNIAKHHTYIHVGPKRARWRRGAEGLQDSQDSNEPKDKGEYKQVAARGTRRCVSRNEMVSGVATTHDE